MSQFSPEPQEAVSAPVQAEPDPFKAVSDALAADLFLYSGEIERDLVETFIQEAESAASRENAVLILCTFGGVADAAYILARFLKRRYQKFTLYIFGYCKSAGTIIALGADEIVMSRRGELGPLDVQLLKADELLFRSSGLEVAQAVRSLSDSAFEIFEKHFLQIIRRGGGAITTRTAAEIASNLAVGLIAPITDQIDPLRVGEVERSMNISFQYGIRLCGDVERVNYLVRNYPSHSFVIDFEEARSLFGNVRQPTELEHSLEVSLREFETQQGRNFITRPNTEGMVGYLGPKQETSHVTQQRPDTREAPPVVAAEQSRVNGGSNQAEGGQEAEVRTVAGDGSAKKVKAAGGETRER
jgi:Serine dehydrogenase proteinase